jgi:hypothetical protein
MIKFAYWKCRKYSRGQKKVRQRFFANVSLFTLSMVTIKIFIYLFIYYNKSSIELSNQLNLRYCCLLQNNVKANLMNFSIEHVLVT